MKLVTPPAVPKRNVFLYGAPKSGKTTALASAPGPVLLVNCDLPNATWFAHHSRPEYPDASDLYEVGYESFTATMVGIGEGLRKNDLTFGGAVPEPVQTIAVDPIGELYRLLLEELSDRAISPTLPTYQAVSTQIERWCRALCESQAVNAVFAAHDFPVHDEASDEVERLPWTGTKNPTLGRKLMSMVDIVGFTAVVEKDDGSHAYLAQLINAKGRRGGDRFDVLGDFAPLDLKEWFALGPNASEETDAGKA